MLRCFNLCMSKLNQTEFIQREKKFNCGMSFENQLLISNHASFIVVALHSGTSETRLPMTWATYGIQVWNAQIIKVRHNAASSVGAAEIVGGRLANV